MTEVRPHYGTVSFNDLDLQFEPLYEWPGTRTKYPTTSPFRAPWGKTRLLLRRELEAINAKGVVLQAFLPPSRIRNDGLPYANATPTLPGVILSISESDQGRLRFPCDTYDDWQDNLRAIALSMEALRKVDRYGVTKGSQYKGLPGAGGTSGSMTATEGASRLEALHRTYCGAPTASRTMLEDRTVAADVIKRLLVKLHPDMNDGQTRPDWHLFVEAKHALERHHGTR